jgi:hypothetical protein
LRRLRAPVGWDLYIARDHAACELRHHERSGHGRAAHVTCDDGSHTNAHTPKSDNKKPTAGLTTEIVTSKGLHKNDVMSYYLVLRRVLAAFKEDPNDRDAYKTGIATLPKLVGLLKSYLAQR